MISILSENVIRQTQPHEHHNETIPLTPEGVIGSRSTWKPEHEQETSFGGKTQSTILKEM